MDPVHQNLVDRILKEFILDASSIHGINHWKRVARNARLIAESVDVDTEITDLFAYFHDCKRENEHRDPDHGQRVSDYLIYLWRQGHIPLKQDRLLILCEAVSGHTHVRFHSNPTIAACFDADRLDLGRCGVQPNPDYLNHDVSKRLIDQCSLNSLAHYVNQ